jgi:hypothetical protein
MPTGTVVQSFASGTTSGGNHGIPGGLATANAGVIKQSYATGVVGAFGYEGGLVSSNGPTGVIEESFATSWVASPVDLLYQQRRYHSRKPRQNKRQRLLEQGDDNTNVRNGIKHRLRSA